MKRNTILSIIFAALTISAIGAQKPKLVVKIVVSQMRYDYIGRFKKNLSQEGLLRFESQGMVFTDARYNFMQTTTPTTLATLTSGANPAVHGVTSERWIDYTANRTITLIDDTKTTGLDCDAGIGQYSPVNLTVPTLGDKLKVESPKSKVITIAASPTSAVVMGGKSGDVYWMDDSRGTWISSSAYMKALPEWVTKYNSMRVASQYLDYKWAPLKHKESYVNKAYSILDFESKNTRHFKMFDFLKKKYTSRDYPGILYNPPGNTLLTEFVKQAIVYEDLGKDQATDIINICYDTPRFVAEALGGESMEFEDMFYRMDTEIAELLEFIFAQVPQKDIVVLLTSDHGASDAYDNGTQPLERFNSSQFKVILNGFMNTQYGSGDWVLDYTDRQVYLNRNLMYTNNLSIEQVQNRVAAFALQFRGVAHVLTSTAMQNSYFGGGYAQKIQNSFYPKRSGDLTINLMPGWIEENPDKRSVAGSMYEYDTHVPLMIMGAGLPVKTIRTSVDMKDVAPTLARIMQISGPTAAIGEPIETITEQFE